MSSEMKPGKGFHATMTPDVIDWLSETVEHVRDNYPTAQELDAMGGNLTRKEVGELLTTVAKTQNGWKTARDSFGDKAYRGIEWQNGELRVTLIRPKPKAADVADSNCDVRIDIRQWYDPASGFSDR